jgi:adenylate kinase
MNPNIILIGAPGAGKGTQSDRLINEFSYVHISTGNLLRDEIAKGSALGLRVSSIIASGNLVDDKTVLDLLISLCDFANSHYIFDGFPRNIEQAIMLGTLLENAANGQMAIYLKIDNSAVIERISKRRVCNKCGQVYSLQGLHDSVKNNFCSKCGSTDTIVQRKDDMPDVVANRLEIFAASIKPMLDYYKAKNLLKIIDASQSEDLVFQEISKLISKY